MNKEYTINSKTNRAIENRPDLCWMDIPESKLKKAASMGDNYHLRYHLHVNNVYLCSYLYSAPARELMDKLDLYRNETYKTYTKSPFFRFYLEYATGKIFASLSTKAQLIYELPMSSPVRLGSYDLEGATNEIKSMPGNLLVNLVARTAIWAPMDAVLAQKNEDIIYVRLKPGQKMNQRIGDFRADNNTHVNSRIKNLIKKHLHFTIPPYEYHVCHIWPTSHTDPRYHSDIRNLVLLPSAIYSLSDHDSSVRAALKYRAYELFGNWTPAGESVPPKPTNYKNIEWLNLPSLLHR